MGNIHTCGPNECVVISGQFFCFHKILSELCKIKCVLDGQIILTFVDKSSELRTKLADRDIIKFNPYHVF